MNVNKILAGLIVIVLSATSAKALAGDAALATEWNEAVLDIAEAEDGFLTLKGLRTVTMMHIAMHDALSSINGEYETYAFGGAVPEANPVVAATQAAYVVAANQYPDQQESMAAIRDQWLRNIVAGESQQAGAQLGDAAARAVLAAREGDGWGRRS